MIGIYKITNTVTNKSYIGQSTDIEHRFWEHRHHKKSSKNLQEDIITYGIDNFTFDILEECSEEELNEREKHWIAEYQSKGLAYNIALGGKGGNTITNLDADAYESYIEKISKPRSEEFKRAQSERFLGEKNPMYGKKASEETRVLLTQQRLGRRWVNNGTESKFIKPEELTKYLNLGYQLGMCKPCR